MLKLIRSLKAIPKAAHEGVISIGNFDGVHLGHQKLIETMVEKAKGLPITILTFEPHPVEFFSARKLPRLSSLREKICLFSQYPIDYIVILKFNSHLAKLSPQHFIEDFICKYLQPIGIVTGDDFHFGYRREGNLALLNQLGEAFGFKVTTLSPLMFDHQRISSTRIRQALSTGQLRLAEQLLGHPYLLIGKVRKGNQLGRSLGCPTANILLDKRHTPLHGIYIVTVKNIAPNPWPAVASIGTRPTVNGTEWILEVHLLDFFGDLYGKEMEIEFYEKIRDEVHFPTLALLQAQMNRDIAVTRDFFTKRGHQHDGL